MANLVIVSRKYHEYLLKKGYTCSGEYYYKDGKFYSPRFYDSYCCLALVTHDEKNYTGYEEEQMMYFEGGIAV